MDVLLSDLSVSLAWRANIRTKLWKVIWSQDSPPSLTIPHGSRLWPARQNSASPLGCSWTKWSGSVFLLHEHGCVFICECGRDEFLVFPWMWNENQFAYISIYFLSAVAAAASPGSPGAWKYHPANDVLYIMMLSPPLFGLKVTSGWAGATTHTERMGDPWKWYSSSIRCGISVPSFCTRTTCSARTSR